MLLQYGAGVRGGEMGSRWEGGEDRGIELGCFESGSYWPLEWVSEIGRFSRRSVDHDGFRNRNCRLLRLDKDFAGSNLLSLLP